MSNAYRKFLKYRNQVKVKIILFLLYLQLFSNVVLSFILNFLSVKSNTTFFLCLVQFRK